MVTQTITLSMIPGGVTPRIYASQNDHGLRVFVFNLVDENGGYAIPSSTTALLNVLKPDRTVVSETCTWSGSTVTADCTEQMTAVAGNVHCEVRLVAANGDAVGSANFILGVESNPLASGVVSESDFDSISDMVDRAVAAASIPPTYVTDWLEENITQETGYVIDKSLTIENAAADAKSAGDLIRAAFVVGEASGSIASFTDGADGVPLKDLVVNISPVQSGSGDPSPSNVRAISGWTEANITRSAKNMAGGLRTGYSVNGTTGEVTTSGNTDWISNRIKVGGKPFAVTLFDKGNMTNGLINIARYKADGSFYDRTNIGYFSSTLPLTRLYNAEVIDSIIIYGYQSGGATAINTAQFQVEFGTAATEYEPYNGDTYNISFGTAGTVYGGTLDVTSGMLTVTRKNVDIGSLNWEYTTSSAYFTVPLMDCIDKTPDLMTSIGYIPKTSWGAFSSGENMSIYKDTNGRLYLKNTAYTDAATFKTAMTGIQLVYPTKNPVSYQLTPTEVKTLLANNNIWSDTGSVASLEYRADTKLYIEHLTNPDDDMVANANITSGSYFMVNNNLYLATANIANGGAITPGTNCTATNLAAALNAINS